MAVERRDLERKLRDIESIVDDTREQARTTGSTIAAGVVVVILLAFLLGRRRGKRSGGARVEVYRLR